MLKAFVFSMSLLLTIKKKSWKSYDISVNCNYVCFQIIISANFQFFMEAKVPFSVKNRWNFCFFCCPKNFSMLTIFFWILVGSEGNHVPRFRLLSNYANCFECLIFNNEQPYQAVWTATNTRKKLGWKNTKQIQIWILYFWKCYDFCQFLTIVTSRLGKWKRQLKMA